jgi:hypothetical protein
VAIAVTLHVLFLCPNSFEYHFLATEPGLHEVPNFNSMGQSFLFYFKGTVSRDSFRFFFLNVWIGLGLQSHDFIFEFKVYIWLKRKHVAKQRKALVFLLIDWRHANFLADFPVVPCSH